MLSVDNLERRIVLMINTTSTESQLKSKYFEMSKPIIVFTAINNEPR